MTHTHDHVAALVEHAALAVHGDEELRLYERVHHFELFLAGVARYVQVGAALVDDLRALGEELVNNAGDRRLVAGNGARGDDDAVTRADVHLLMLGKRHAVERGHALALAAGGEDDELIARHGADALHVHKNAVRHLHIAELHTELHHVFHAPPRDADLALVLDGEIDDLPDAVHVRGERRYDDALVAVLEELVEAVVHLALGERVAGALHVRGVHEQREHALAPQLAEAREIGHLALQGRDVDLEVAGLDNGADRRFDRKRHGIGDRVVHVDELHLEAPGGDRLARLNGDDLRFIEQATLLQLELHEPRGQARRIDGRVDPVHHIRQRADVVLVAVREKHTADAALVLHKIAHVGNDNIHAVHIVVREAHAAVHDYDVPAVLIRREVLADLVETAKGNDLQFLCHKIIVTPVR